MTKKFLKKKKQISNATEIDKPKQNDKKNSSNDLKKIKKDPKNARSDKRKTKKVEISKKNPQAKKAPTKDKKQLKKTLTAKAKSKTNSTKPCPPVQNPLPKPSKKTLMFQKILSLLYASLRQYKSNLLVKTASHRDNQTMQDKHNLIKQLTSPSFKLLLPFLLKMLLKEDLSLYWPSLESIYSVTPTAYNCLIEYMASNRLEQLGMKSRQEVESLFEVGTKSTNKYKLGPEQAEGLLTVYEAICKQSPGRVRKALDQIVQIINKAKERAEKKQESRDRNREEKERQESMKLKAKKVEERTLQVKQRVVEKRVKQIEEEDGDLEDTDAISSEEAKIHDLLKGMRINRLKRALKKKNK